MTNNQFFNFINWLVIKRKNEKSEKRNNKKKNQERKMRKNLEEWK